MKDGLVYSSLEQEGRALVERLGGRWTGNGGLCLCPAHDDRNPSLSVRPGQTRLLLHCFAGCAARDILDALKAGRLIAPSMAVAADAGQAPGEGPDLQSAAIRLWGAARPLENTPAEFYLASRGLIGTPALRFHARTPHGPRPLTRFRAAMIAAVRDKAGIVGVQRTFLQICTGRPSVEARSGLGRFGEGAVRLAPCAARLGLAEGIESALSASALVGVPCWATLGTERFALVSVPPQVTELLLFLDHDVGGRRAEALARAAHPEIAVEAFYPPRAGDDWNDVLMARASAADEQERGGCG
jgi:putative DNA primase/helicase